MLIRGYEDLYGNPCIRAVPPADRSTFGYVNGHLDFQYGSPTAGSSAADANTAGRASAAASLTWRSRSAGR